MIIINSTDADFNGSVFDVDNGVFVVVNTKSHKLTKKLYTKSELEKIFGSFSYSELLFG